MSIRIPSFKLEIATAPIHDTTYYLSDFRPLHLNCCDWGDSTIQGMQEVPAFLVSVQGVQLVPTTVRYFVDCTD